MKKLFIVLFGLFLVLGVYSQNTDRHRGDVIVYGNIKVLDSPVYTILDSCIFPFTFFDSIRIGNVLITPSYLAGLGGSPGGSSGDIQYNNAGSFGGAPMTTDGTDVTITNILNLDAGLIQSPITTYNVGLGYNVFNASPSGQSNIGIGYGPLDVLSSGQSNIGIGRDALGSNTTGGYNTAIGQYSLFSNVSGQQSTGVGYASLQNATGNYNSAFGASSLQNNSSGESNLGLGRYAGTYNTTQSNRIYINTLNRTNILGDSTKSPIYVFQSSVVADQRIDLNGVVSASEKFSSDSIESPNILYFKDSENTTPLSLTDISSGGGGVTPTDNILHWNSTSDYYEPYSSYNANTFYLGTTFPTSTTRLNMDYQITPTQIWMDGSVNAMVNVTTDNGVAGAFNSTDNYALIAGNTGSAGGSGIHCSAGYGNPLWVEQNANLTSATGSNLLYLQRNYSGAYDVYGDVIFIDDSPAATGTVSGSILNAEIDGTTRINLNPRSTRTGTAFIFDTDSSLTTGLRAQFYNNGANPIDMEADGSINLPSGAEFKVNGTPVGGGGGTPGGSDGDIQYNNSGAFGGAPMTTDGTDIDIPNILTVDQIQVNGTNANAQIYSVGSVADGYGLYATATSGTGVYGTGSTRGVFGNGIGGSTSLGGYFISNDGIPLRVYHGSFGASGRSLDMMQIERDGTSVTADISGDMLDIDDAVSSSGTITGRILVGRVEGTERTILNPRATATQTAYTFDCHTALTSGYRARFYNNGSNPINFDADGSIDLPSGAEFKVNGTPLSGGTPGGSSGDIQYNNSGSFGGAPMTTDGTDITATNDVNLDSIHFADGTTQGSSAGLYNPDSVLLSDTNKVKVFDKSGTYYDWADLTGGERDTLITFTPANLNDGDSVGLLPYPGTGYAYAIQKIVFIYNAVSTAYTTSILSYTHWYSNGNTTSAFSISSNYLGNTYSWVQPLYNDRNVFDENSPFWIIFDSGLSGGDGILKIQIFYEIYEL